MRHPVKVDQHGPTYWVDDQGRVWNQREGGTAWKHCAEYNQFKHHWVYDNGNRLILVPVPGCGSILRASIVEAPPIGLRPATCAVLEYDKARCKEIGEAMLRYAVAMKPIPEEWLTELQELTERNQPEMPTPESLH